MIWATVNYLSDVSGVNTYPNDTDLSLLNAENGSGNTQANTPVKKYNKSNKQQRSFQWPVIK